MNAKELFEEAGEAYLHPTQFGESLVHFTIEELYQAFKERMMEELLDEPLPRMSVREAILSAAEAKMEKQK